MTLIKIDLRNPALNGNDLGAAGYVELSPTARRHTDGTPDWVTLPTPVFVYLGVAYVGTGTTEAPQFPAVEGVAYVDLAPTLTGEWCWKSVERVKRGIVRYVAVPNAVGPIDYGDLADVDPDTLNPTTPVIPAYQALFALKQDIATLSADTAAHVTDGTELDVAIKAKIGSLAVAYRPAAWAATTAYKSAQIVVDPSGNVVSAKADFTSGVSYDGADWNTYTPPVVGPPQLDLNGIVQFNNFLVSTADAFFRRIRIRNVKPDGSPRADQAGLLVTDVLTDGHDKAKRLGAFHSLRDVQQAGGLLLSKLEHTGNRPAIDIIAFEAEAGTADVSGATGRRLIGVNGIARHRSDTAIGTGIGVTGAIQIDDPTGSLDEASAFRALLPAKFAGAGNNIGTYEGFYVAGDGDLVGDATTTLITPTNWVGVHSGRVPAGVSGDRLAGRFLDKVRSQVAATTDTALEGRVDGDSTPRWKITGGGGFQSPDTDTRWIGAAELLVSQGTTQLNNYGGVPCYLFDAAADERASGQHTLPSHWLTFAVDLHWSQNAIGAGDVRWRWEEKFIGAGDSLTLAAISALVSAAPASLVEQVTTLVTGRAVTASKRLAFGVTRTGSNAADTLAGDCGLTGVTLRRVT